jgi:hypothetical protein
MRESTISAQVRKAIARSGKAIVTRNNVGMLRSEDGRHVRYGLGIGSADLVGMLTAGPLRGRVFCLEIKQPGRAPTTHQRAWARAVRARGGFVTTVHSEAEALAALERALAGAHE